MNLKLHSISYICVHFIKLGIQRTSFIFKLGEVCYRLLFALEIVIQIFKYLDHNKISCIRIYRCWHLISIRIGIKIKQGQHLESCIRMKNFHSTRFCFLNNKFQSLHLVLETREYIYSGYMLYSFSMNVKAKTWKLN